MIYIGIDPGVNGGVACIGNASVDVFKMPNTPIGVVTIMQSVAAWGPCMAVLELAQLRPRQSGALTIGRGFGRIETALAVAKIPFDIVTAQKWQAAMQCLSGGDKAVTKLRALQLFPHHVNVITNATADALLLAEYCRRLDRGMLPQKAKKTRGQAKEARTQGHQEEAGRPARKKATQGQAVAARG